MLFNSYIFIFLFLPAALFGYFGLNHFGWYRTAKLFLVGMSLWFYAYYRLSYLWIILSSIAVNYVLHRLLLRYRGKRWLLTLGVAGNIGLLFYFKYFTFLCSALGQVTHTDFSLPEIVMPLGISFFTFQQIGFLVDTYRGEVERQNVVDYALFVTFFPQLIAGPIVNQSEMLPQFQDPAKKKPDGPDFYEGLRLFILGLGKKVLLADVIGQAADWGFTYYTLLDGMNTWLVMLLYTLQLYFDFSGYCDMARGIGRMFRIELPVNFYSPYKSRNIREFWDRWHMSLTRFFTRYVYIPLGGSRKGRVRTYINVFLVFVLSGIWHGAGLTYLTWGALHGAMSVLTRLWQELKSKMGFHGFHNRVLRKTANILSVFLTFAFVTLALTFFRADSVGQALAMVRTAFSFTGSGVYLELAGYFQVPELWYPMKVLQISGAAGAEYFCFALYMIAALWIVFALPNVKQSEETHRPWFLYSATLSMIAVWSVLSLSGVSTFLYFNF
ncbi:MAG: MBOAT family protein [Lachnospiraceae bacterium]|nr:MBOAT family protein [Lachnospiraceae bacterium]